MKRARSIVAGLLAAILWPASALPQDVQQANAGAPSGRRFCRALPGYRFVFPRDHFAHPCFRTEWWYFTGNLVSTEGRRFGLQLTFFREGIDNPYPNPSRWRVEDLYLAHFAVSDIAEKNFFHTRRLNRAGIELAGADQEQGRIWNGDWSARVQGDVWRLEAAEEGHRIQLALRSRKPPVIQGRDGVSQKADGEGHASHYYSLTRLETAGRLQSGGETYDVTGWSWMDHEFSTNLLQPDQVGWDWVSLQMEDGTEWMLFQLRLQDGTRDPHSAGSFVDAGGRARQLSAADFQMLPLREWRSPHSGGRYPIGWRIRVPALGLAVEISAAFPDQELVSEDAGGTNYWEGSVVAEGTRNGVPVRGRGYLEMTGYGGPLQPELYAEK